MTFAGIALEGATVTLNGTSLSGVTVTLSSDATATTATNSSGLYNFSGLYNGSYTVTPSLSGDFFAPANRSVTLNNANATG